MLTKGRKKTHSFPDPRRGPYPPAPGFMEPNDMEEPTTFEKESPMPSQNFLCEQHNQTLLGVNETLARNTTEIRNLSTTVKCYIQAADERESRREARASRHSADIDALKKCQSGELKYWTTGKRIILYMGLPAVLGWIVYLAGFFKGIK